MRIVAVFITVKCYYIILTLKKFEFSKTSARQCCIYLINTVKILIL